MKKLFLSIAVVPLLLTSSLFGEWESNLKELLGSDKAFEIIAKDELKSLNLELVIVKNSEDGQKSAWLGDAGGDNLFELPKKIVVANQEDMAKIEKAKRALQDSLEMEVYEIVKTIPKERFIHIESFNPKNKTTIYMITDPECPYCREDMQRIVKYLRNGHVKIIFAPVHGKSAYTKAALMLRLASKIEPNRQDEIIKILEKYYDKDVAINNDEASDEERDLVLKDAKVIFSKGLVKGVPFTFSIEKE